VKSRPASFADSREGAMNCAATILWLNTDEVIIMRFLIITALVSFLWIGCSKQSSNEPSPSTQPAASESQQQAPMPAVTPSHSADQTMEPKQQASPEAQPAEAGKASVAGIEWQVPSDWKTQEPRPMRVVTYSIPGSAGAEDGECGVFYFGTGQGGDTASNIQRWESQFEMTSKPEESSNTKGDLKITTVKASGTYLSPGGPMMQSQGKKPNYALHGVIVEGPQGSVFFKMTGPSGTMKAAEGDIATLIASIKKQAI
jgi:hypothetical protein